MKYYLIRYSVFALLLAMIVLSIFGCQTSAPIAASGPPIVLDPQPAAHAVAPTPATAAAVVLLRDTAALRSKVTRYVVRKDASPEVIDQLTAPTAQMSRALERLQAHKTRAGYSLADVVAARIAADALAAVYQVQIITPAARVPDVPSVPTATPQPNEQ